MEQRLVKDLTLRYNRIKYIDEQAQTWRRTISDTVLESMRQIFLKHDMIHEFGLALLHRHQELPPDLAMVHSKPDSDTDLCYPQRFESIQIYPSSYHLYGEGFLPYEFSSLPTPPLKDEFLHELAQYISGQGLEDLVAISHVKLGDWPWLERPTRDKNGTEALLLPHDLDPDCDDYIITEWVISHLPSMQFRATKACVKDNEAGGHTRVPDK